MAKQSILDIETASDRVVCRWPQDTFSDCNPVDEEVLLQLFQNKELIASFPVENLSQKEIHLPEGSYDIEVSRFFKAEVEVRTPLTPTPSVSWVSDSPVSHLISWTGFNWDRIRREVERIHRINWDTEAEVSLRLLTSEDGQLKNHWVAVPFRDHSTFEGHVEEIELAVVTPEDKKLLKSLFLAKPCPRKPQGVIDSKAPS